MKAAERGMVALHHEHLDDGLSRSWMLKYGVRMRFY
jgi:hypothetical protein